MSSSGALGPRAVTWVEPRSRPRPRAFHHDPRTPRQDAPAVHRAVQGHGGAGTWIDGHRCPLSRSTLAQGWRISALPTSRLEPSLSCRAPISSGSILAAIEELERAASAPSDDALHLERLDALEAEVREVLSLVDQPLEGARWMAVGRLRRADPRRSSNDRAGAPRRSAARPRRCSCGSRPRGRSGSR